MSIATAEILTESRPINVSYVIGGIHTEQAGTEGQLLRLIRRYDRNRCAPNLVVMQSTKWTTEFSDVGVPMNVLGFRSFQRPGDWLSISKLARMFKQRKTQVVELHSVDAHFVGAIAARLAKVPVVISCRRNLGHDYSFKNKLLINFGNRLVTTYLANSKIVADKMSQLERIDRNQFHVIHNGVDLAEFDRDAELPIVPEVESQISGKRIVTMAANLRPVKNHHSFLKAAAILTPRFKDLTFVFLGDGPLRYELQVETERLGIADRTVWLGSVPSVAAYLKRSHVACLSSDSEGFSNSIIEYMAAGLPVVATDVGGASEAIVDGESGFLVPPDNPERMAERLEDILRRDDTSRVDMGRAGRLQVENHFSFEQQLEAYQSLYERALESATSQERGLVR